MMTKTFFAAVVLVLLFASDAVRADAPPPPDMLRWSALPPLPEGVSAVGAFAGVSDGALIIAGGGAGDRIFVLRDRRGSWTESSMRLARPLSSGSSLTTEKGVVCIGGSDGQRDVGDVFILAFRAGEIVREELPPLPSSSAGNCAALLDKTIYVAAGHALSSLDLTDASASWKSHDPWPGPPRTRATAAAQHGSFFLFGGVDADEKYLADAYRFTPGTGWMKLPDMPRAVAAAPSPAPAVGPSHVLILGGKSADGVPAATLAYHTITNTWATLGALPATYAQVPLVRWGEEFVIPGGANGHDVAAVTLVRPKATFGLANLGTLALYPIIMLSIGFYCARKKKTSDQFFRASQQIPWWAAGLSIYATMLSSLTFMAVPAKVYISDWGFFLNYFSILLLAPVIIYIYLPFFRRLDVTSAYEYLERRFNLIIRLFGSASFIAFQIARTGIVLFLPALALATVSDIDVATCIIGMTLLSIALTVFGGMEAVIWTDVAQTFILLGAVLASLIVVILRIDGGFSGMVETASAQGKFFENVSWSPDMTIATGWVIVLGFAFNNLISYTSNQEVVQRYLTTTDTRQAAKAIWTNALFSVPSGIIFFGMGTALYVFYQQHPERLDPTIQNDAIFPLFMLRELPAGVAGFVVAGIFAAAQPTSGLNSTATAFVTDFYRRLKRNVSDREAVLMGRIATVMTGLLGMSVALVAVGANIRSIWELFINMMGLTTGILAGLFALGIVTRRANGTGATLGLVAALALVVAAFLTSPLHPMMYGVLGVVGAFVFGYAFSLPFKGKAVEGLTIYGARGAAPAAERAATVNDLQLQNVSNN